MAQAQGGQPWGEQGEEGMARSSPTAPGAEKSVGVGWGVRRCGGAHGGKRSWREGWERGKNNRNSQYLLNSRYCAKHVCF